MEDGWRALPLQQKLQQLGHPDVYGLLYRHLSRMTHPGLAVADYFDQRERGPLLRDGRTEFLTYVAHFAGCVFTEVAIYHSRRPLNLGTVSGIGELHESVLGASEKLRIMGYPTVRRHGEA